MNESIIYLAVPVLIVMGVLVGGCIVACLMQRRVSEVQIASVTRDISEATLVLSKESTRFEDMLKQVQAYHNGHVTQFADLADRVESMSMGRVAERASGSIRATKTPTGFPG